MKRSVLTPLHRAVLEAWQCAFADTKVAYLSGPITSGPRQLDRLRNKGGVKPTKADVIRANCEDLKRTAALLRRQRREIIVEPASLNITDWSQADYLELWAEFIERHVDLIIFMPGWPYSLGSAHEFYRAVSHDIRRETVSGSAITLDDGLALLNIACRDIEENALSKDSEAKRLFTGLKNVYDKLERLRRPTGAVTAVKVDFRKDQSLDWLADKLNVAQFVSFAPSDFGPCLQYSRIAGMPPNAHFDNSSLAIHALLKSSSENSVNVRSYEPHNPQSREFIYGLKSIDEVLTAVSRLTQEGLHTIVNETIDVHDGGVSGVLMGDVLEFSPDDTPRAVEKPGTASLPRGWGRDLLATVYGFPIEFDVPLASRLEFSIHPRPRGWRQTHILAWEYADQAYVQAKPKTRWPNRFSKMIGDKVFGLLVAHHVGLPIPFTTVLNRRVAPFSFGCRTNSGETWIRTAPLEQVPGKFTTRNRWVDPFKLLAKEDPDASTIASVLSQDGVKPYYSGALIVARDGDLIIEGKAGEGETFMLGKTGPEDLPASIVNNVRALYESAEAALGLVRFEWVHDGQQPWIVQLHCGGTDTTHESITAAEASRWHTFDISAGLDELRKLIAHLPEDTGIVLSGRVGLTSHIADVLRRANVPARMS